MHNFCKLGILQKSGLWSRAVKEECVGCKATENNPLAWRKPNAAEHGKYVHRYMLWTSILAIADHLLLASWLEAFSSPWLSCCDIMECSQL